jgi:hypothetical protein
MTARVLLRISPDGVVRCLHTEALDLRSLGRLSVVRATRIVFDAESQSWQVREAGTGGLLFSDPSRDACTAWERDHMVPGPDGPLVAA